MKSKLSWLITPLLALFMSFSYGQGKTISGNVTDQNGLPLPGVSIVVVGTNNGTQTDFDGNFALTASVGQTLRFTYLGQKTENRVVGASNTINVQMEEDAETLDEVVVQGYRTATKETSSIASSTVSSETIVNRPNASVVQTLSGQVAGLNITAASGQPGAAPRVTLRGVGSINGNTDPLYVIDGIPVDAQAFRSLGNNDIESISVLKDAGATAIYGNRGANGVVVIKTRNGSFNQKLSISYSGLLQFTSLVDNGEYELNNSQEQLLLEREFGNGRGVGLTDAEIAGFTTTDYPNFFFDTGLTQQHTVNLSSGSENATQFTSLGFRDEEGILSASSLQRFNYRTNVTGRTSDDKFSYGANLAVNYSQSDEPNAIGTGGINRNIVLAAFQSVPYISPDEYTNGAALLSPLSFANTPLFIIDLLNTFSREENELQILGSFNADYKLYKDLTARVVLSGEFRDQIRTTVEGPTSFNALLFAGGRDPSGFQTQSIDRQFTYNQVTSLNYNKTFGKHTIDGGAYVEYFRGFFQNFGFQQFGLTPALLSPGDGDAFIADNPNDDLFVDTVFANRLETGLFSYFFQGDWDYDTRFGVTGTIRRDASFRFAESNRFGTFGSVSGRWNIDKESWFDDNAFDVLKLRGSWGVTGNQNIAITAPAGLAFDAPDLTRDLFTTGVGQGGANSLFLNQIGNNTLRWEATEQIDIGVDFEVFQSKLRGSVDVYQRTTTDLFLASPVSSINAVTQLNTNTGEIENRGVDLTLNYDILRSNKAGGLNLTLNFVGNFNEQEVIDLPTDDGRLLLGGGIALEEGGRLSEYFLVRYAGVNPANGNLLFLTADGEVTENPNVDTDRVFLGKNLTPDFQGSFGFDFSYKGWFATTQWNYVIGVDRIDNDLAGFLNPNNIGQFRTSRDLERAFTPDNRITDIPSLTAQNLALSGNSDRFLQSADFLRLRFATIGYDFPSQFLEGTGISNLRIFAQGENILTFTPWRGFDPEVINTFNPAQSRLFPTPRVFAFGLEVGF